MKKIYYLFMLMFTVPSVSLAASKYLSAADIDHVKAIKAMISDVDHKPLAAWIDELQSSRYPQLNISIKEAMAKAYVDIVRDQGVVGLKKKEWLYSMIALNMAYMQFGGGDSNQAPELDKLIRRKLKSYLPPGIVDKQGFHYSLE